jgi:ParB-like chromosome segregation protein Spo0J
VDLDRAARDYRRAMAAVESAKQAAERKIAEARQRAETARITLAAAMIEAANDGVRPVEIQKRTGYTKERVRQILRAGGVEPD